MLEDDLVCAFADVMRSSGFWVLAEGANQGSFFRFDVKGRAKAPDLVALKREYLIVAECKLRGRDSFRASTDRDFSDFESMAHLAAKGHAQIKLAIEAATRVKALGLNLQPETIRVVPLILAMDELETRSEISASAGVTLVEAGLNPARVWTHNLIQ
jgi:Holliday junction resolvase